MKTLLAILFLLSGSALAQSLSGVNGDCMVGGAQALTSGLPSTATQQIGTTNVIPGAGVQGSYPSCLVSVYATGTTTKAAIWADNSATPAPLANPFTANGDGSFTFFSGSGCYDIVMSSGIAPLMPYPRTLTDLCIGQGATGVGGTGTPPSLAVWVGPTQLSNSTITDDLVNPPASPNGLNFVQGAAFYTAPNCNPGTVQNHLAQISGNCVTLNTQTTNILGIAGPGSGNVGNVSVATNLTYSCVFDNQTTAGDWAVAGTPADECDDAGASRPTTGVQILGHIANANSGAGTMALVIQNTGDTVQAGASSGNLLNCATSGALWFAATADTTGTCDPLALTDGAGNETATSLTLTGIGAGFFALVQGTAPTLTDANAAYFAAPTSVATSFLTLVPAVPPVATGCLQGVNSAGVVTLSYTGSNCGSGSGSVTSFSAGTLSPLFTTSVATPTTTPALSFILTNAAANTVFANLTGSSAAPSYTTTQGTDTKVLTSGTVSGTGVGLCTDANGGATTSGCSFGSGTVSSVSFTGGLISVANPTTTPAFTVAGTSGGIPYFSGASTWASSGALTANLPVIGGGAGIAPTVGTRTGNTTQFATWTGATTAARCVDTDASGNLQITAADCSSGGTTTITTKLGPQDCTGDQSGNVTYTPTPISGTGSLTNWVDAHWQIKTNTGPAIYCKVRIPSAVAGTPAAQVILEIRANDTSNSNTANYKLCDNVVTTNYNVSALTCTANQTYTATATAYGRVTKTFTVNSTVAADNILVIEIVSTATGTPPTNDMFVDIYFKVDQSL